MLTEILSTLKYIWYWTTFSSGVVSDVFLIPLLRPFYTECVWQHCDDSSDIGIIENNGVIA